MANIAKQWHLVATQRQNTRGGLCEIGGGEVGNDLVQRPNNNIVMTPYCIMLHNYSNHVLCVYVCALKIDNDMIFGCHCKL